MLKCDSRFGGKLALNFLNTIRGRSHQFVFPNSQNSPALATQPLAIPTVALNVGGDFCIPVLLMRFWPVVASGASVPEAAINENDYAFCAKDEIRLAG
jgi:hypothetical protein